MQTKKCPVCDWEIKQAVKVEVTGKVITVCCEDCAMAIKTNPSRYTAATK